MKQNANTKNQLVTKTFVPELLSERTVVAYIIATINMITNDNIASIKRIQLNLKSWGLAIL